jgi:L-fuculose-phosphate aldolase
MGPGDIVSMRFDGTWDAPEGRRPSSEWRFHRDILAARPEIGGVVHTHARYATVLACQRIEIPAFHYMVGIAGGATIRCAPYATFGTEELSDNALAALEGRKACLLANHGMIACGEDLAEALKIAVEVEALAAQYWHVLQLGKPKLLGKAEMRRVLDKFAAGYGYASGPAAGGEGKQE